MYVFIPLIFNCNNNVYYYYVIIVIKTVGN